MNYSFTTGEGVINPPEDMNSADSLTLEDVYELTIEIDASKKKVVVREIGGRIMRTKYRWKLSFADVHMYQDGSLCLCPEPEEKLLFYGDFSLRSFFYNYLIPNLYYQTYLSRFGNEPWKSSSHEEMGILESYPKQIYSEIPSNIVIYNYVESLPSELVNWVTSNKKIDRNLLCICGSGKRFRDCHEAGFRGLTKLKADYRSVKTGRVSKEYKT